jgi:hypothetical protein
MNEPHSDNQPSFELPQPIMDNQKSVPETQDTQNFTEKSGSQGTEMASSQQFIDPSASSNASQSPVFSPAIVPVQATPTPSVPSISTPPIADDVDLIEKEWVEKAKEIVNKTKDDPYAQNQEMTKIKADYLKKRYNKDIKLPKD